MVPPQVPTSYSPKTQGEHGTQRGGLSCMLRNCPAAQSLTQVVPDSTWPLGHDMHWSLPGPKQLAQPAAQGWQMPAESGYCEAEQVASVQAPPVSDSGGTQAVQSCESGPEQRLFTSIHTPLTAYLQERKCRQFVFVFFPHETSPEKSTHTLW